MRSQSGPVESDGLRIIGDVASPPRTVGPGWSTWRADAMMGRIRLVNPDRGTALAASSGRLVAASTDRGGHWELRLIQDGREYFTRRPLNREEARANAAGKRAGE